MTASSDGEIRLWDLQAKEILSGIQLENESLYCADLSADGNELITSSKEGNLRSWDMRTGEMKECIKYDLRRLWMVAYDPDGDGYMTGGPDRGFALRAPPAEEDGEPLWRLTEEQILKFGKGVYRVRFSPDGKTIASTRGDWTDRCIHLWDGSTGEWLLTIEAHQQRPEDIAFSPDGSRLFSVARDEVPAIWDTATGRQICTLPCTPISFGVIQVSPNGRYVVAGGAGNLGKDGRLLLWELPDRTE